jgi:hypothetical protein
VWIEEHHEGYISWQDYEQNQEILAKNRPVREDAPLSSFAREGHALLQGLLLCGRCGRRLAVRYMGNGGIYPMYICVALKREGLSPTSCMHIRCDLLDEAIVKRVLEVVQPAQVKIATEAIQELERRDEALLTQWQMRLERAEYEARLAERRYEEVDPSNRLVASTLEQRWNDALVRLEQVRAQYAEVQQKEALTITAEQRAKVRRLVEDFPRLWNAPSTKMRDKKRMVRLLIKDITIATTEDPKRVVLQVRWQGGACEEISVIRPPSAADQMRYPEEVVQRVRELARDLPDEQVARVLDREGLKPSKERAFTAAIVGAIRYKHHMLLGELKRPDELTVTEIMERFGVSRSTVHYWIKRGVVETRRRDKGSPHWVTLTPDKEDELRRWVRNSRQIQKQRREP